MNSSCTFKLDTYHLDVQNVTLCLQCQYRLIKDILSFLSWVQDQDKTKTRQSLSWKTKTKPRQDKLCLGKTKTKPRQDVSWFCLVLDPRQILFVLSWSCLGFEDSIFVLSWSWDTHAIEKL